ncbi:unnamed protein product [Phytophthora fragariaefolia]|uniref:Unnamed protein product n=1 Tax=Phytophthora fragariaefolia TaxID=1490495 RepID=A0A9W6YDJ8_9STRA|nr:unnamed protein product [Phytophthora fragariaefolia]
MSAPLKTDADFLAEVEDFLLSCNLPVFPSLQALDVREISEEKSEGKLADSRVRRGDKKNSRVERKLSAVDAAAKLEQGRAKDRMRRNAYRERRRLERNSLKQQLGKLGVELERLRRVKECNKSAISASWELVAKRQLQARLNAEADQRNLCTVIGSHATWIEEFRGYISGHGTSDVKDLLFSDNYHRHKRMRDEPSDAVFFDAYLQELDVLYVDTEKILTSSGLATPSSGWDESTQEWEEEGQNGFYRFVDKLVIPFGFKETSDILWTVGRLPHRQEDRQAYIVTPNTMAIKFRNTSQLKSGRVVSVLQRVVSRRYDDDGKMVIVWRSFTKKACSLPYTLMKLGGARRPP